MDDLRAIATDLRTAGIQAAYEYPGFVQIPLTGGRRLNIGTVNGCLGFDVTDADDAPVEVAEAIVTSWDELPAEADSPTVVAAINQLIATLGHEMPPTNPPGA